MKTHNLAKELSSLAKTLRNCPNVDVLDLPHSLQRMSDKDKMEMAFGISTLTQLSKFSKQQWIGFIEEHNLPIDFNSRDSARNLIGKIMNYLESNEEALQRVGESVVSNKSTSSEKLNRAFSILMRD